MRSSREISDSSGGAPGLVFFFAFNFLLFLVENYNSLEGFVELIRFLFGLEIWSPTCTRVVFNVQLPLMSSSRRVLIIWCAVC